MRIYCISDIHSDHAKNMEWVVGLDTRAYANDCLLVAGDVSHSLAGESAHDARS